MAYDWEDERIRAQGKAYQYAQAKGDSAGMKAAEDEAARLRKELYGYQVKQNSAQPTVVDGSKWSGSSALRGYEASRGLGSGVTDPDRLARNTALQSGGSNGAQSSATGTAANGTASGAGGYGDLLSKTQKSYADLMDGYEKRNRLAVDQGVAKLEASRSGINQNYDDLARQAYIRKMQSEKALPQSLAAQGLSGGASETSRVAIDSAYGNSLNSSELARKNALDDLDRAIADVRYTGDLDLIDKQMGLQQQAMADYRDLYEKQLASSQSDAETARQRAIEQIPAYYEDYTAYINKLKQEGDPYGLIPYVMMARNEKVSGLNAAQAEAEQQDFENQIAYQKMLNDIAKTEYQINKPYFKYGSSGGSGRSSSGGLTDDELLALISGGSSPKLLDASNIGQNLLYAGARKLGLPF